MSDSGQVQGGGGQWSPGDTQDVTEGGCLNALLKQGGYKQHPLSRPDHPATVSQPCQYL